VVDDYGHHPTEIEATLKAARSFWPGRIMCVFQPHRYSRTKLCSQGFTECFEEADQIFITDIYAAGEDPIEGVTGENLAASISQKARPKQTVEFTGSMENTLAKVAAAFQNGDLVLCMGAGSITRLPELLIKLAEQKTQNAPLSS
jgi:UDP-N-acetylmuramate--alanine ligase